MDIKATTIPGFFSEEAVLDFGGLGLAVQNSGGMRSSADRISRRKLHLDRKRHLPMNWVVPLQVDFSREPIALTPFQIGPVSFK
jgi:hypothetical protein